MSVYNVSYEIFLNNKKSFINSNIPEIKCYMPRTFLEDCYNKYNEILKLKTFYT